MIATRGIRSTCILRNHAPAAGLMLRSSRRYHSSQGPSEDEQPSEDEIWIRQSISEKKDELQKINANQNFTDAAKLRNSIRIYKDIDVLECMREMEKLYSEIEATREVPEEFFEFGQDPGTRKMLVLQRIATVSTVFAPWSDVGIAERIGCAVGFILTASVDAPMEVVIELRKAFHRWTDR